MDELIDKLITMAQLGEDYKFDDEEVEEFELALWEKGIIKRNAKNQIEVISEVYEKIKDKKDVIIASSKKNGIAQAIVSVNPSFFFSVEEMKDFLDDEKIMKTIDNFGIKVLVGFIKVAGEIEKYLTEEWIEKLGLIRCDIVDLIKETDHIEDYLNSAKIEELDLYSIDIIDLIKVTGHIEDYLNSAKIEELGLNIRYIVELIKATGHMEDYLNSAKIEELGLQSEYIAELIKATGHIEDYLNSAKIKELGLKSEDIADLVKETGHIEDYLNEAKIKELGFRGKDISSILLGREEIEFAQLIDVDLKNETYNYKKYERLSNIIKDLQVSNSSRLAKIAIEVALPIYELDEKQQEDVIESIKSIYCTTDLPIFAQNFLVFKQLHPNLLEENYGKIYEDAFIGNVPSLTRASISKRNYIIFSDLLRIAIESNNRNVRDYLYIIEQGNNLFNLHKEGKLKIDDTLTEENKEILKRYSNMLNALYNQTSKGKRLEVPRKNSGDLEKDLQELSGLLLGNTKIKRSLPDRIVRMFGYWAGIKDFEQAKELIESKAKEADRRNRTLAEKGEFIVQEGDFAKGIGKTEYFASMLQNGIVAKDYLGSNSKSDATPLDMDVELIKEDGHIQTAKGYTNEDINGRKLGKIIIVIKNDGSYVRTKNGTEIDEEAVKEVIRDKTKKEYFDNNGKGGINAYGIRTGIGSTNISYIIAERYVDKLGLEIVKNGFYIPVVDDNGKLLFTPEMYDELRSKMQGMSYYGISEFELDESAKNSGTESIIDLIEPNIQEAGQKRQKILQTLQEAIEKCGLKMSDKRRLDLIEGIVDVVDTGSTGRGTNEPGDGDFDFMIRLDSKIFSNSEQIKEELKKILSKIDEPLEVVITVKGDFRFKGVSIQGLKEKIDIDLTFIGKTDEIEYTTEECIRDRLETIRRNNPEEYKYVVANILLAKKVLKTEGAYKKKNAPEPEEGKKDTRGGLGAVGIENWILQNGGSFEKAARSFLEVAKTCKSLEEFQQRYAIWDFGENYTSGENYPHDNFIYNMNEQGYEKMQKALEDYIQAISTEKEVKEQKSEGKSLADIVSQDPSILRDTTYMLSVNELLSHAGQILERQ